MFEPAASKTNFEAAPTPAARSGPMMPSERMAGMKLSMLKSLAKLHEQAAKLHAKGARVLGSPAPAPGVDTGASMDEAEAAAGKP